MAGVIAGIVIGIVWTCRKKGGVPVWLPERRFLCGDGYGEEKHVVRC